MLQSSDPGHSTLSLSMFNGFCSCVGADDGCTDFVGVAVTQSIYNFVLNCLYQYCLKYFIIVLFFMF